MNSWYVVFREREYTDVRSAVMDWMKTHNTSPNPAGIAYMLNVSTGDAATEERHQVSEEDFLRMLNYLWPDVPEKFADWMDALVRYRRRHGLG